MWRSLHLLLLVWWLTQSLMVSARVQPWSERALSERDRRTMLSRQHYGDDFTGVHAHFNPHFQRRPANVRPEHLNEIDFDPDDVFDDEFLENLPPYHQPVFPDLLRRSIRRYRAHLPSQLAVRRFFPPLLCLLSPSRSLPFVISLQLLTPFLHYYLMHHPSRIHMPQGAFALFFIGALYYHLWHQLLKHMIVHVNDRVDVWKRVLSYIVTALYFAHYLPRSAMFYFQISPMLPKQQCILLGLVWLFVWLTLPQLRVIEAPSQL